MGCIMKRKTSKRWLHVWVCAVEVVRHCGEGHLGCHVCVVVVELFGMVGCVGVIVWGL